MNDIAEWVSSAKNQTEKNFRSVVHIILSAISSHHDLQPEMMMKGGILMAIAYHTGRYTKDVDFSTPKHYREFQNGQDAFIANLSNAIKTAAEESEYGISCSIQNYELRPGSEGNYQTLHLTVGYALKANRNMMKMLAAGHAPKVVRIDYSFNEMVGDIGCIDTGSEEQLQTYGTLTLIAEKFRALLQQTKGSGGRPRGSARGQDVFDLHSLLSNYAVPEEQQQHLLELLIDKAKSRDLILTKASISDPEIAARSKPRYLELKDEIDGELPDFDVAFNVLKHFYEKLPWRTFEDSELKQR